ncbi:MAG TPA: hypothetical protein VK530_16710 [Candidatus Acidoferrum sp.]|nr:hypothetical protein [Candidatus Acidoferrum sp.]
MKKAVITFQHVERVIQMLGISEADAVAALLEAFDPGDSRPDLHEPTKKPEERTASDIEARLNNSTLTYKGTPVREMLAYPMSIAAKLVGLGGTRFWTECAAGKIRRTPFKTVPRVELERYLAASLPPLKQTKGLKRTAPQDGVV